MKPVKKILIVSASFIVAMILAVAWFLSPAVPQRILNKLTTGMPQIEAERLLGRPNEVIHWDNNRVVWRYTSPFHSGLVDVFFFEGGYSDYNYERF